MSEPTEQNATPDDDQPITDEMLPEDLQPAKNPLARDPDDDGDGDGDGGADDPDDTAKVEGLPDMGQPG